MKKFIVFTLSIILPCLSFAQAHIETKKVKIADFSEKITKVVLTGNMFHDAALKKDVSARWNISPFEFCTTEECNELLSDSNYYFLLTTTGQFRNEKEPGLVFLTLVKGGASNDKGLNGMLEIISFPFASAEEPSGREYVFLPTILDMIQTYITDSTNNDVNGYIGLPNYTLNIYKSGKMNIIFSETDLSNEITPEYKQAHFDENIHVLKEEEADEYLTPEKTNTLVSYVVVPSDAKSGSYCYKMLFDTESSKLYYFRKHKLSKKAGAGFLAEDIKRICSPRKK